MLINMSNLLNTIDPSIACIKCGGSISVGANKCSYCDTKYDRDLTVLKYGVESGKSGRNCPDCEVELQSIDLEIGCKFIVERCEECYGIFLDKLELEELLKLIYNYPGDPDVARLNQLLHCPDRRQEVVKYRNCPDCKRMMARKNFGKRSGVVMDVCRNHGTWLDGGELYHLIKWSSAGGQNGQCSIKERDKELQEKAEKRKIKKRKEYLEKQEAKRRIGGTRKFR